MPTPRPPRRPRLQAAPALRDSRLVAFLMYLTGASPEDEDDTGRLAASYAQAVADARALLHHQPLTTACHARHGRSIVASVWSAALRQEPDLRPLVDRLHGTTLEDTPITAMRGDFRRLLDSSVNAAILRGAALLYDLLTGGAR